MDLRFLNKKARDVDPAQVGKDYVLKMRGETSSVGSEMQRPGWI